MTRPRVANDSARAHGLALPSASAAGTANALVSGPDHPMELVAAIYDAALDTSLWPEVLRRCRDYVGGMAANLYAKRSTGGLTKGVYYDDGGLGRHYQALYRERFVNFDPATPAELRAPLDEPVCTADLGDFEEFRDSRFYREWQQPQGMVDFMCAPIARSGDRTALFGIFRHERDGMVDERAKRRMRAVVPHIRRAVHITEVVDQRTREAATFREALDGLAAGLFFVDPRSRIVHANRAGGALLDQGTTIVSRQGKLGAVDAPAARQLTDAAAAASGGDAVIGTRGIAVPIEASDGDRFAAHVLPLTSGERRLTGSDYTATAAVFVHRVALDSPAASQLVARGYGLTPGEERVLAGVVENVGVAETAEALGIGEATVKTHLHRVFAKTDTRRQADLVKLVAGYSSPLRPGTKKAAR